MTDEQMLRHLAAEARRRGLTVWQWLPGHVGTHAANSLHNQTYPGTKVGRAFDAYGSYLRMARYARWLRKFHRRRLTEGIFNGRVPISRLSVKSGGNVRPSFWGVETWREHKNHVHVGI